MSGKYAALIKRAKEGEAVPDSLPEKESQVNKEETTPQKSDDPPPYDLILATAIHYPPDQPRKYFDPEKMAKLVESIRSDGILEPIIVRPVGQGEYELVAGERRLRAALSIGMTHIPAMIRSLDDHQVCRISLLENLQREELNPIEQTEGILQLLAIEFNRKTEEVISLLYQMQNMTKGKVTSDLIDRDEIGIVETIFNQLPMTWESFVTNRLPIRKWPENLLNAMREGKIEFTKIKMIRQVKHEKERDNLLQVAIEDSLSLNQIRELVIIANQKTEQGKSTPSLKEDIHATYHRVRQSDVWKDPKKKKRLERLLNEMKKLLDELTESKMSEQNLG